MKIGALIEKKEKKDFDWGEGDGGHMREFLENEIFTLNQYQSIYPVKEGDVVVDFGASIGPFTWDIMDKASKVYAVEPMVEILDILKDNTSKQGFPVEIINKALSFKVGEMDLDDECIIKGLDVRKVKTMDFQCFLEDNKIDNIDFLKCDCEGGEYSLFSDVNMDFLLNNVGVIVGEWHLHTPMEKIEFRYFRDKYLKQFPNYEIRSLDGVDIKWDLDNEHFIEYYNQVIIHINNRKVD